MNKIQTKTVKREQIAVGKGVGKISNPKITNNLSISDLLGLGKALEEIRKIIRG